MKTGKFKEYIMRTTSFLLLIVFLLKPDFTSANNEFIYKNRIKEKANYPRFIENKGQIADFAYKPRPDVLFQAKLKGVDVFILKDRIVYQFVNVIYPEGYMDSINNLDPLSKFKNQELRHRLDSQVQRQTYRMDMKLLGANPNPTIEKDGKSYDYLNFYTVPCPHDSGCTEVYSYSKVILKNIYPHIDWVIYTTEDSLAGEKIKYDFVVHPGGNPKNIRFYYSDAESIVQDNNGGLDITNRLGTLYEAPPYSTQEGKEILSSYERDKDTFSFQLTNYNPSQKLIIDPIVRLWATYYGGINNEKLYDLSFDSNSYLYVCGETNSPNNIAFNGFQNSINNSPDAMLIKLDTLGTRIWATYYGGTGFDILGSIGVFKNYIYSSGSTWSTQNIAFNGHQNVYGGGGYDGMVVKFDAFGFRIWGTYYGGTDSDQIYEMKISKDSFLYLSGTTSSPNNIAFNGFINSYNSSINVMLIKFDLNGARVWGTYYAGAAYSLCVDDSSNAYIVGGGASGSNPAIAFNGHQNVSGGGSDAIIVKFDKNCNRIWGTFYGGDSTDFGRVCTCKDTNLYVLGHTRSINQIAFNGHQNVNGGGGDGFLVKFNTNGNRKWGTYIGGISWEWFGSIDVDHNENIYIAGGSNSSSSISLNGFQNNLIGLNDAVVLIYDSSGSKLWGSYYGGNNTEVFFRSKIYKNAIYCVGYTTSTQGFSFLGHQNTFGGGQEDACIVKFGQCVPVFDTIDTILCSNQTILFNGIIRNIAGIYHDTLLNINGCDSIITLKLFINNITKDSQAVSICGSTYMGRSSSGLYQDTFLRNGCDSIVILNLTLRPVDSLYLNQSICKTQSYIFKNQVLNTSGLYRDTLINQFGCDSFIFLNLTVNKSDSTFLNIQICEGQTYPFNNINRNIAGLYRDTLTNQFGCDSFIFLNLTTNKLDTTFLNTQICEGQTYPFNNINRNIAGLYRDTLTNQFGCDSLVFLNLTINKLDTTSFNIQICEGQTYPFNNINRNIAGIYRDTLINRFGCDSFIFLNLTVLKSDTTNFNIQLCEGQTYRFNNTDRNVSGIYRDTLVNRLGCDSFIFLNLNVKKLDSTFINAQICDDQVYNFNNVNRNITGIYRDTLINRLGCDSFVFLILTVLKNNDTNLLTIKKICEGSDYKGFNTTGTHFYPYLNPLGCISYEQIELEVSPKNELTFDTIHLCYNQSKNIGGVIRKEAGDYMNVLMDQNGCDSPVLFTLKYFPKKIIELKDTSICRGVEIKLELPLYFEYYLWNDGTTKSYNTFKEEGVYSVKVLDSSGCIYNNTMQLFITDNPVFKLVSDTIIEKNTAFTIQIEPKVLGSYHWSSQIKATCKDCETPNFSATESGWIKLEVVQNRCKHTDSIYINIVEKNEFLSVPNAFSPNKDKINDELTIKIKGVAAIEFAVFNRWGEKVYAYIGAPNALKWDGYYKGSIVPPGLYLFTAKMQMENGTTQQSKGEIYIMR